MKSRAAFVNMFLLAGIILVIIGIGYLGNIAQKEIYRKKIARLAQRENIEALKKLIEDNPEIIKQRFEKPFNEKDISLVHMVCGNYNLEGIRFLKELGADFSLETSYGNTPLIILARTEFPTGLECIKEVMGSKSVCASSIALPNKWGWTPVLISIKYGQPAYLKEYMRGLKDGGVEVDKNALLQYAVKKMIECDETIQIVSYLVSEGANPTRRNSEGESALDIAQVTQKKKFLEIMANK